MSTQAPHTDRRRAGTLFLLLAAAALVAGVLHASKLWYVDDDCFVSFRYARNFINGLGLVYNAEERVEGFTNFLWTMLIALGMKLHIDPIAFSTTLGIASFGASLALFSLMSWNRRGEGRRQILLLPLTSLALCLHHDTAAHATSGMETAFFSFLISAAFALMLAPGRRFALPGAGFVFTLAMLTRPDGVVFLGAAILYLLLTDLRAVRSSFLLCVPVLLLFVPYWFIRYSYYGFFFPNTFYAKSIDLSYYSQGFEYARLYAVTYPVLFLFPVLCVAAVVREWRRPAGAGIRAALRSGRPHPVLLAGLFAAAYILFTIRIGGDFMFARFFIPITPFIYFGTERLLHRLTSGPVFLILAAVLLLGTAFRFDQYGNDVFVGYVADEQRYFHTVEPLELSIEQASLLRKHLGDFPVRVGFYAGQLRLIYYLDPPFAVECSAGLTDTAIAHQSLAVRGRPGHEKKPTTEYLRQRRVQFYLGPTHPVPAGQIALNAISFDSLHCRIITYDNAIMNVLERDSGVAFIHLPSYLDRYIADMHALSKSQVYQQYLFLKPFYFDINRDSVREAAFLRYLE